jgi:DNA-binding beta-propeller fold protein YncE
MSRVGAALALVLGTGAVTTAAAQRAAGGNGTFYFSTYAGAIYEMPEATMTVTHRIPFGGGMPDGLTLTKDRKRVYASDARFERIRVFDLATRSQVDSIVLSSGDTRVRMQNWGIDPLQRFVVLLLKTTRRLPDRYEIGPPRLVRYDLARRAVVDTIPWPKGEDREFAGFQFSPDGKYLYLFGEDILVYETSGFTVVDRWLLSQPIQEGMGRFGFGFPESLHEEPGYYTGLFRTTDPVQNRRIMGVARVNLGAKSVDFYSLGPDEPVGFTLAPDRKKAYGLKQTIGTYEFWTFDLEGRRVAARTPFAGRPRMALLTSTNGRLLYVYGAGSTIDVYDAASFRLLRTVTLDADMMSLILVPPGPAPEARAGGSGPSSRR